MNWGNSKNKYSLGGGCIDSSPEEKDLGVLVDQKLAMSQQGMLASQKGSCVLGCIQNSVASKVKDVVFTLYFTLIYATWTAVQLWQLPRRRTWTSWSESREGPGQEVTQRDGAPFL